MKKTRKLIPAVAMLMTSAVMMSTASYAWFSMNKTVTAGDMEIKATADANLYIAKGVKTEIADLTATAVTDLGVSKDAIAPVDMAGASGTVTVQIPATYSTNPDVDNAGTADTWTKIGSLSATEATNEGDKNIDDYCAVAYVTIGRKATVPSTYTLKPSCTVTLSEKSELNKALRVGMIINNTYIESADMNTAEGTVEFTLTEVTGLSDNEVYSACLMFWFEGEDSDCYINNAISLSANTAAWSFTAE